MTVSRFAPLAHLGVALALTVLVGSPARAADSTPFTLTTGTERTPEQLAVRFDKADLAFKVLPDTKTIDAVATLDFTATAPLDRLVLELDTVFAVSSVSVDGQTLDASQWTNPDGRMTITLPAPLAAGGTASVRIAYAGSPHQAKNAPWDGGFVWAQTAGATTTDHKPWIATAVQGEGCDLFWPCIDHPEGEPARADLHITIPSDLSAPSNGRFLGKTDNGDGTSTWNWTAAHPDTYAIALNIGPYVEMTADYHSRFGNVVPLHFWRLASDRQDRAEALFAEFPKMLDFYEAEVGPFPFGDEKMGVVETPHLGMEHQTINAYGNAYKLDGRGYDWLMQHELAHEWFGNQMTNATWDDMWLHEGLGSYMQPLYARWLNGDRYMESELTTMRLARHRLGDLDAVDRRREDAAGIARAFAGREQAGDVEALEVLAAGDADRRGGAGLDAGHQHVGMVVAGDLAAEHRQGLAHGLQHERRQAFGQVGHLDARLVGRLDHAQLFGRLAGQEVADLLGRGGVGRAAGRVGQALPLALELDAGQRVARIVALRVDADHEAGVGVALVARILAHAVGHDAVRARTSPPPPCRPGTCRSCRPCGRWRSGGPGCSRPRPGPDGRRRPRSAPCPSTTADARSAPRSRTAWPRCGRPGRTAPGRCRGRCGRRPAPRARPPGSRRSTGAGPSACASRRRRSRCRSRRPDAASDIRRPGPRWSRACSRPWSPGGRCRCADGPRSGSPRARRP
jgi:hypothetical protein